MSAELASLVQEAGAAAARGRWQDAERIWSRVQALDPDHVQALFSLGVHAFQRGDTATALEGFGPLVDTVVDADVTAAAQAAGLA